MTKKLVTAMMLSAGILAFLSYTTVYADVKLKIAVVNPSTTDSQTTPVKFELPKGVGPEQVIDAGDMEFKYDFDKSVYYVCKTVTLKPSEKLILEIKLHDLWTIPDKDIESLKKHSDSMIEQLKGTKHYDVGTTLLAKIDERLNNITAKQQAASLNTKEQINSYYENTKIINEIKEDIGNLENLVVDVGGVVENRVRVPTTMAVAVGNDDADEKHIKDLTITVVNPSSKDKQTTKVRYPLPSEVSPRYIVDEGGLEIGYDFNKEAFYAYKNDIVLAPFEKKTFVIRIKDIWRVSDVDIASLRSHTANLMILAGDTEYAAQGKVLSDKITRNLNDIVKANDKDVQTAEHIAIYRNSLAVLDSTRKLVAQLEKLISQSGASPGVTIEQAEYKKGGGPKATRAKGYQGIDVIAKSVFKGKAPNIATTWKIIFVIMAFVGMISALFFALWYSRARRKTKIEPKNESHESDV